MTWNEFASYYLIPGGFALFVCVAGILYARRIAPDR